jgi:hypothetical protein
VLAAIIVLSLVPPGTRPATFMAHNVEHASIFLFDGIVFSIAYRGYDRLLSIGAMISCASIKLSQQDDSRTTCAPQRFFVGTVAILLVL